MGTIASVAKLLAALTIGVGAAAVAQTPIPTTPPNPPVLPDGRWTPASYTSNTADFVDEDGDKQGTMILREWWYSYAEADRVVVVGTAELTITPVGQPLTSFNFTLEKGEPECIPYTHDPDTNNSPITFKLQGQIGKSGPSVGGTVGGVLREDKVTIENLVHDGVQATWTANVGGGREGSGVNSIILLAKWSCPTTMDLSRARYRGSAFGGIEIDDYGPNTTYWFADSGVGGKGKNECHRWTFDLRQRRWICQTWFHEWYSGDGENEEEQQPRQRSSADLGVTEGVGQAPAPRETSEQRLARLEALKELRTGQADKSGTEVTPAFSRRQNDPSRTVREQVAKTAHQAGESRDHKAGPQGSMKPVETAAATPATEANEAGGQGETMAPPSETVPTQAGVRRTLAGRYRVADTSAGAQEVTITESGGRLVLNGLGQPIALEQQGETYVGEGATLFGKGGHRVQLRQRGDQIELIGENSEGQEFTTTLAEVEPVE